MSIELAIYKGIGRVNKGEYTAVSFPHALKDAPGTVIGSNGCERVKMTNKIFDLGDVSDIDQLMDKRHEELIEQEIKRHKEQMANLEKLKAA